MGKGEGESEKSDMDAFEYSGYRVSLVDRLLFLPPDTRWLRITRDDNPDDIGKSIAALANSAALHGQSHAYALWGVDGRSRTITGTRFNPPVMKKGDESLDGWLRRLIRPQIDFRFRKATIGGLSVIVLKIDHAVKQPATFKGIEYIRSGDRTICIGENPSLRQRLLGILDEVPFTEGIADDRIKGDRVMRLLDIPTWFRLLGQEAIDDEKIALEKLHKARLIRAGGASFDITNAGALLLAKNLPRFDHLKHKVVQIVRYEGRDRKRPSERQTHRKGYALDFAALVKGIGNRLSATRPPGRALGRAPGPDAKYDNAPGLGAIIRELLINALVHQDFSLLERGPQVEIFDDRIEFTNPGKPLVEPLRFVDSSPEYRNEALAWHTRRLGIRAAWDSGLDKVIAAAERLRLPPPLFENTPTSTKATLYAPRPTGAASDATSDAMSDATSADERLRACYQHACLRQIEGRAMTCASLQERMGFENDAGGASASARILEQASALGLIAIDKNGERLGNDKSESWLPFWAPRKSNFDALD